MGPPPAPARIGTAAAPQTDNTGSATKQGRPRGEREPARQAGCSPTPRARSVGLHRAPTPGSVSPALFHSESESVAHVFHSSGRRPTASLSSETGWYSRKDAQRNRDRQRNRHTDTQKTDHEIRTQIGRQTDTETETDTQTYRQSDRQAGRQADRQTIDKRQVRGTVRTHRRRWETSVGAVPQHSVFETKKGPTEDLELRV